MKGYTADIERLTDNARRKKRLGRRGDEPTSCRIRSVERGNELLRITDNQYVDDALAACHYLPPIRSVKSSASAIVI